MHNITEMMPSPSKNALSKVMRFGATLVFFMSLSPAFAQTDSIRTRQIGEVVVTGSRTETDPRHLPMTLRVVDNQTLRANYRANLMTTVAEQVPGLFLTSRAMTGFGVSNGGSGELTLRGMSGASGRIMVLVDGHPQYNGIYGHPISDAYLTTMAERVEVVSGPASVIYGSNAMGGVINIVSRSLPTDGTSTDIGVAAGSWGTVETNATNRYRSGRFSSTVAAQYGHSDNHRPRMGFTQYGGHLKLGYDFSRHWMASVNADITHFSASQPGTTSQPMLEAEQWITRGVGELALTNRYAHSRGGMSIYYNFGRHKINDGYNANGGKPQTELFRSTDALAGVSVYQTVDVLRSGRLTLGIDYQHIYGHAWYTSRETGEIVTTGRRGIQSCKEHNNEWAGYADYRHEFASWLTLDAGLRLDNHSQTGSERIPQFGLVVRPMATGEIKAMASRGFRNPSCREMYLYGTANDRLKAERMWNYELSWRQRLHRFAYSVTAFYLNADNLIETRSLTDANGNAVTRNVNTGEIENWGLEAEASWMLSNSLSVTTNHSYLHTSKVIQATPEYKGYIGARWNSGRWTVNGGLMHFCGVYINDTHKENATLLNATVTFHLSPMISIWGKGENLLAQHYSLVDGYPMPRATFMGGIRINL